MPALVSVDGETISVEDAVRRSILHNEDFLRQAEESLLIRKYAQQNGFSNSDAELQLAADELRYQQGLESVEKLHQWIAASHQTLQSLQDALDDMLLRNKVRSAIPESSIAAYFAEHKTEMEAVELYSIRLSSLDKANEILEQINEGSDFHALAVAHSEDEETRHLGGYANKLSRGVMTGEIEAVVFHARPGTVVGPVRTSKGYNLFKIAALVTPKLDEMQDTIRHILFTQLLEKLRSESSISYPVFQEAAATA
jgi:parvulin-like peptidyl-prolyl isomerase